MIVALDGIPGNQVEGISPLYAVTHADGSAGRSAVVALQTTMSAAQLERALTALHAAHEGAVTCHIVQMSGIGDEERAALDTGDAQHRAAVLAPWMDMDPQPRCKAIRSRSCWLRRPMPHSSVWSPTIGLSEANK